MSAAEQARLGDQVQRPVPCARPLRPLHGVANDHACRQWLLERNAPRPAFSAGRYQLLIYCEVCHRGPGGNLVANNWYFDGKRRTELNAFNITRAR